MPGISNVMTATTGSGIPNAIEMMPLSLLPMGQEAVVTHVAGSSDQVHRLHEIGLCDGARIQMVRTGQTCIIRLNGHKLCFRGDQATSVMVCPCRHAHAH